MRLLVFAHRGESQEFLKKLKLKAQDHPYLDLYCNQREMLLITQEGVLAAATKVSAALTEYPEITEVINLGIAGALNRSLELEQIVTIRTSYAENEFKSFTSQQSKNKIDCISANSRVLSDEYATKLSYFADTVDRELWGIAQACHLLKKPFYAIKLISDYAGKETECFDLRNRAKGLSEKLLDYYLLNHNQTNQIEFQTTWTLPQGFYATATQKRQINRLLKSLSIQWECSIYKVLDSVEKKDILENCLNNKERTSLLISRLKNLAAPYMGQLEVALNTLSTQAKENGIQLNFDPKLEKTDLEIALQVKNQNHLNELINHLRTLRVEEIQKLLNGKDSELR